MRQGSATKDVPGAAHESAPSAAQPAKPCVMLSADTQFHHLRLSKILEYAGFAVRVAGAEESLTRTLASIAPPPSLVMVPVYATDPETLARIAELRRLPGARHIPILGVTTLDRSRLDLRALRALGVVGLVDKTATPEHVAFRVNQVVRPELGNRRFVRVPVFFPVDVATARHTTTEYARSLSVGGMGLTGECRLEPNEEVRLTFRLDPEGPLHTLEARVIHCRAVPDAFHEVGVFFHALGGEQLQILERWVARSVV